MNRAKRRRAEALARTAYARAEARAIASAKRALINSARNALHPHEHAVSLEVLLPEDVRRHHELAPVSKYSRQIIEAIDSLIHRMDDRRKPKFLCAACDYEFDASPPPARTTFVLMQRVDDNRAMFSPVCEQCAKLDPQDILKRFGAFVKRDMCPDLREL